MQVYEPNSDAHFEIIETGVSRDPVVVLIHGSLDRSSGMARLARLTSVHRQVIRYDRRGYGDSWQHPGPFTVSGNVDDVVAILDTRPAILIGHSYAGQVVLACASRLQEQIVGLSTYETPLSWLSWWPSNTAGAEGIKAGPDKAAESFMIRMIGEQRWNSLPEKTKQQRRREGVALVAELEALRTGPSWQADQVNCPVLCAVGSIASKHHHDAVDLLVGNIKSAKKVVLDGASHGAHLSHADEFFKKLIKPHIEGTGTLTEIS